MNTIQIISLVLAILTALVFIYNREVIYFLISLGLLSVVIYPMLSNVEEFVDSPVSIDYIKSQVSKL